MNIFWGPTSSTFIRRVSSVGQGRTASLQDIGCRSGIQIPHKPTLRFISTAIRFIPPAWACGQAIEETSDCKCPCCPCCHSAKLWRHSFFAHEIWSWCGWCVCLILHIFVGFGECFLIISLIPFVRFGCRKIHTMFGLLHFWLQRHWGCCCCRCCVSASWDVDFPLS